MMDDLISRQAAIDAIRKDMYADKDWMSAIICDGIENVLNKLPSAQPELDEWCTDCKEYDKEKHRCPRWNRVIRSALEDAQPERKTGRWIESNPQNSEICRLINCSECGKGYIVNIHVPYENWVDTHKFCVECGAKMVNHES